MLSGSEREEAVSFSERLSQRLLLQTEFHVKNSKNEQKLILRRDENSIVGNTLPI